MLFLLGAIALTAFLGYVIFLLFWDVHKEKDTSFDCFISQDSEDGKPKVAFDPTAKYFARYENPGKQVLVLYGTEYGCSEEVSRKLFDQIVKVANDGETGVQPRVLNARHFELIEWEKEQLLLCVFSTTGDGVPPTDVRPFMNFISSPSEGPSSLTHVQFSLLALGDSNYPHFCMTGRTLDSRLEELGASRFYKRVDVDQEDWSAIEGWMRAVVKATSTMPLNITEDYLDLTGLGGEGSGHSRTKPFMARVTEKALLTVMDTETDKETIHMEFDITGSELQYTSGDALGIWPCNNPPEVAAMVTALHCEPQEQVAVPGFCYYPKPSTNRISLREALLRYYDLKVVKMELVQLLAGGAVDISEKKKGAQLLKDGLLKSNSALLDYITQREVVDVLRDFSSFTATVHDILEALRPLQPRYYSIASSPAKDSCSVAVCAAVIRYSLFGEPRTGVCTTFLQDRLNPGEEAPVFISHNPDFRLPAISDTPIIMIGPGTGIAPFRAFLQERVLQKSSGQNVLYFGCRHQNKDFVYKEELERLSEEGWLTLRTAFSRDQPQKRYVQHLMMEDSELIWKLVEAGGHIYVCGDAKHMASDVHQVLLKIISLCGNLSEAECNQFMQDLERDHRYQRDVWVT